MPSEMDLHMHSTASDVTDAPVQLAEKVRTIGITDHDTIAGTQQLAEHLPEGSDEAIESRIFFW